MLNLFEQLGLGKINHGTWLGSEAIMPDKIASLISENPSTAESLGEIMLTDEAQYHHVVNEAYQAFLRWREIPAPVRGNVIRRLSDRIRSKKDLLAQLITLEMGKPLQESAGEVQEMLDMADFALGQSRMLYGKTMHSERPKHRMYEQWHPLGVVGVITAFNFPMAVWAWNAMLAAVCGNVVIWKPSSKTPLCAIAIQKMCASVIQEMGLPAIFSLITPKDHTTASLMLDDSTIPLVSFTGSTQVGQKVAVRLANRLGRSLLELGGNNAVIIDKSADLTLAISAVVFGAVGTTGQRCTTTRRVFIHESIFNKCLDALKNAYARLSIGDPLLKTTQVGPLVDKKAIELFQKSIQDVESMNGLIHWGGHILSEKMGYYVEPTIVSGISYQSHLMQEERFVPILYLHPFQHLEEAIGMQNAVMQGLSSSLFTQNLQDAELFLSSSGSDCGLANINVGTSGAEIGGAFGGEKATGGGREAGSDAWKSYMRRQTNVIHWGSTLILAQDVHF